MTSFDKIVLLPEELKILKRLKNGKPYDFGKIDSQALFDDQLIEPTRNGYEVRISDAGRRYLVWRHDDIFRNRWPVYIAIASCVVSVISMVLSGVSIGIAVSSILRGQ